MQPNFRHFPPGNCPTISVGMRGYRDIPMADQEIAGTQAQRIPENPLYTTQVGVQ